MTDEDARRISVAVETAEDGVALGDAERLRLVVEGEANMISALAELVVSAVGGTITRATSYGGPNGEEDVTEMFVELPTIIDPLSTGDEDGLT